MDIKNIKLVIYFYNLIKIKKNEVDNGVDNKLRAYYNLVIK